MKKYITIIYYLILISFTIYVILDTLVISKAYESVENNTSTVADGIYTNNSYEDENIKIELSTYKEYDTTIYVADIYASSEYLKTAFAKNT